MERRSIGRSAQYGQACMSCFKAKSRCVARLEGDGCERCHRLHRECLPSDGVRRRTTTADGNQDQDDRIVRLESRLEGIVSLLESRQLLDGNATMQPGPQESVSDQQQRTPSSGAPTASLSSQDGNRTGSEEAAAPHAGNSGEHNAVPPPQPGTPWPPAAEYLDFPRAVSFHHDSSSPDALAAPLLPAIPPGLDPPDHMSMACLDRFRSRMLRFFPIFHFPPYLTVQQLHHDRPFLFKAIVCVAWPIGREKKARAIELTRVLCEVSLLQQQEQQQQHQQQQQQENSHNGAGSIGTDPMVDLLLAVLTYVAWGWDHLHRRRSLSRLMMLCMSLVGEMRLDRPAPAELHTANLFGPPPSLHTRRQGVTHISQERRRAVLGCFVLSSVVSSYFDDMEALRWAPQMEEIRIAVQGKKECPADADLVRQVLLQQVATKTGELRHLLRQQQRQPNLAQSTTSSSSAAAVTLEAIALLGHVREIREDHSRTFQNYKQIPTAHSHYVEVLVLEIIRTSSAMASLATAQGTAGTESQDTMEINTGVEVAAAGTSDLGYMWQSVLAISSCTSDLLSLGPEDLAGISFLQWAQLAGCVVVLGHLESLQDPRLNLSSARAVVDLPVLLDRAAERLALAAVEAGERGEPDGVFAQLASGMCAFRSNIQMSAVELSRPGPAEVSGCGGRNVVTQRQGYFSTINMRHWMDQFSTE